MTVIIIGTLDNFGTTNNDLPATIEEEDDNNNNNDAVELELSFYPSRSYILPTGTTNPSVSYTPTYSPTSCIDKISLNKQLIGLPSSFSSISM